MRAPHPTDCRHWHEIAATKMTVSSRSRAWRVAIAGRDEIRQRRSRWRIHAAERWPTAEGSGTDAPGRSDLQDIFVASLTREDLGQLLADFLTLQSGACHPPGATGSWEDDR